MCVNRKNCEDDLKKKLMNDLHKLIEGKMKQVCCHCVVQVYVHSQRVYVRNGLVHVHDGRVKHLSDPTDGLRTRLCASPAMFHSVQQPPAETSGVRGTQG